MAYFTQATASSLGAVLDCDLNTGLRLGTGGTPTDNTAILNAFLATGTASNPVVLVIDGPSVITGLFLPTLGHASIVGLGWDTGFYMKSGSNQDAIHNGPAVYGPFDPGGTAPTTFGLNVSFRNFRINGNRGNGTTGNSNTGNVRGNSANTLWLCGINLMNLKNIRIENIWFFDIATYSVRCSNCAEIVVDGIRVEAPSNAGNTDGVHFSGPNTDIRIGNSYFQTGDDAIPLNAPEGYGGSIARVVVTNCVFNSCTTALRAYVGTTAFTVSRVAMSNCTGSFAVDTSNFLCCAILLGLNTTGTKAIDGINDFTISNCTFSSAGGLIYIGDSCGTVNIDNVTWKDPASATGIITFVGQANVSSLNLTNIKIYRSTLGSAAAFGLFNGGISGVGPASAACSIGKLKMSGFDVDNETGQSFAAIANLLNMTSITIGELVVDALDTTNITTLAAVLTGITTIRGAGLSQTGFQLPDNQVAPNTLYISATGANVGKLCIQYTAGVVTVVG